MGSICKEIAEYSKYTLGQIVPVNIFILGATPIENVTDAEKTTYNTDFQTVQQSWFLILLILQRIFFQ